MKIIAIVAAIFGLTSVTVPVAASAQNNWRPVAQRQANLDQRIDQGIRSGRLSRPEARRIQAEYRQLDQLENRYRRSNGLSASERRDLDRRYDALSARVRYERMIASVIADRFDRRPCRDGGRCSSVAQRHRIKVQRAGRDHLDIWV